MSDGDERCWLCSFWSGSRCTQTWRLSVHIDPSGGICDFTTTPGMVPEHIKGKLSDRFGQLITRFLLPLIEKMPEWAEITKYQEGHPELAGCPGHKPNEAIRPFLKVVRP